MSASRGRVVAPWLPTALAFVALGGVLLAERLLPRGALAQINLIVAGGTAVLALAMAGVQLRHAPRGRRQAQGVRVGALALVGAGVGLFIAAGWAHELRAADTRALLLAAAIGASFCGAVTALALELSVRQQRHAPQVDAQRTLQASGLGFTLSLGLVALVLINFGANRLDRRVDMSYAAPTAPSEATLALLRSSARPIEFVLFFEKQSPVLAQLRDYFEALEAAGASLYVADQALEFDLAKRLDVNRNGTVSLIGGERHESWSIGEDFELARRRLVNLDTAVRERLAQLTREQRTVYLTHEHGERPDRAARDGEPDAAAQFGQIIRSLNNKVLYLSPARLGREVPRDADLVVIHGPSQRFLPHEVASLRAYVSGGGALLLLLDPDADHGLEPLLATLGLAPLPGVLAHEREFFRDTQTLADRGFIFSTDFTTHPSVRTLNDVRRRAALMFRRAGALERLPDTRAKTTFVARTRARTFLDTDQDWAHDEHERSGLFNIAAAVELAQSDAPATRALVVADSDVLDDKLLTSEPNLQFALDALLWLLRDEQQGAAEVAAPEHVPIRHTRDRDLLWFYGSTFLAPLSVLLLGLGMTRWQRRRKPS